MPTPRAYTDAAAKQRAYRERQRLARQAELAAKGLPPSAPLPTMPSRARWAGLVKTAQAALETAQEEMQAYWDDRSDAWQAGDKGTAMQQHIEELERIAGDLADLGAEIE